MNLRPNPLTPFPTREGGSKESQIFVTKSREGRGGAYDPPLLPFLFCPLWLPEVWGFGFAGFGRHGLRAGASRSLLTDGPVLADGRIEFACAEFASQLRNRGVTPVFWGMAQLGILRQPFPDPLLKGEGTRRRHLFAPFPRPAGEGVIGGRAALVGQPFVKGRLVGTVCPPDGGFARALPGIHATPLGPGESPVCTPATSLGLIPRSTNKG